MGVLEDQITIGTGDNSPPRQTGGAGGMPSSVRIGREASKLGSGEN